MALQTIAGAQVNVSEEGYLENMNEWNENIAKEIASESRYRINRQTL